MYKYFNPNPTARRVGDCAVRAVAAALDTDWETAYSLIAANGYGMGDMPSSNSVWGSVLRQHGFYREAIPNTCPDCYTVRDFCHDHPEGVFVLCAEKHVVTCISGDWLDIWDSGDEPVFFYWYRKDDRA